MRKVLSLITGPVEWDTVANNSPPLQRFCLAQALSLGDGPLPRNTASIMQTRILILICQSKSNMMIHCNQKVHKYTENSIKTYNENP